MSENSTKKQEKFSIAKREEEILAFWEEHKIFEKSLAQNEGKESFVFYDGPPFATGTPHYGHILASVIKDAIPRYQTMRGKHVRRVWGWDCHGLPIENLIEKELNLENKKAIEELGIDKFNEAAKNSVFKYDKEWKKLIPRIGRWIDMEHGYKTMDASYTESVWWAFKELHDKGLVYKGFRSMHICPRCETTLSASEVADGYKDITDISVTAKFELVDEPGTYVLAWTTTPWTLPGNVALAVGEDIEYANVRIENKESGITKQFILAKDRIADVLKDPEYEIVEEIKGKDLVGKAYKPLFNDYANDASLENRENGWKIVAGDFVTTESGTGVVHIAPAFGEDDMELGKLENLPFVQHVTFDGKFTKEVKDFAGLSVKPKDDPQATDIEIIKYLAHNNLLFAKEKIIHSYPHCWRCDTPLLNYATSSWFIKVSEMRDKLLEKNSKVNWVPGYLKDGRFGKWLENARDWSISRTRFWGAPLPVWQCEKCEQNKIIGSVDEIKQQESSNSYLFMRHGQSDSNKEGYVSNDANNTDPLTDTGREQVEKAASALKSAGITRIFASSFARTTETAEIAAEKIGIDKNDIIYDDRLWELNTGEFNKRPIDEYRSYFKDTLEKFTKPSPDGETLNEMKNRLMNFLYETDEKYKNEKILIVGHEYCAWLLEAGAEGMSPEQAAQFKDGMDDTFIQNAEVREIKFTPLPHNDLYELDLHRPNIDSVTMPCSCGGLMKRIPDVFDCWVESGSMPFAQFHYPFENEELFKKNFPADFIAEGIDQTRGWFYTMLVISTTLFDKSPYKNVVVNGLIQAEDGRKMSKKLKNYPEPDTVLDRYGADALRYYLLTSPVVHAEELRFSEQGVDEVTKKVIMRLLNVVSFYELYAHNLKPTTPASPAGEYNLQPSHVLDKWIISRLDILINDIESGLEKYELDKAVRPVGEFIDDLSTWYLRRSRDRFKGDDEDDKTEALATTRFVLESVSRAIAPIMPFVAEDIYKKMRGGKESVHLEEWPETESRIKNQESRILEEMEEVRRVVSLGLEARASIGIKVRQPLQELRIKNQELRIKDQLQLLDLVKGEVNVKEILFDSDISEEVELDANITPELKKEGLARELVRRVQELRKKTGLTPEDTMILQADADRDAREIIETHKEYISKTAGVKNIEYVQIPGDENKIELEKGMEIKIKIK